MRDRLSPTEAADRKRRHEVVPQLIEALRRIGDEMARGPDRMAVLSASNWLDSLSRQLDRHESPVTTELNDWKAND